MRSVVHAVTEDCMLQFIIHLLLCAMLSSVDMATDGLDVLGCFQEFWLPEKRSSLLLMVFGGGCKMTYGLR
jgi:hypothetical protein